MVIIRINVYFTLLLLATYFGSFYRSHLQAAALFTSEGEIYDNIVKYKININYNNNHQMNYVRLYIL